MKATFTIELEGSKKELNDFANNINHFVHRRRNISIDVKPIGGYVPRFYLPKRKYLKFKKEVKPNGTRTL